MLSRIITVFFIVAIFWAIKRYFSKKDVQKEVPVSHAHRFSYQDALAVLNLKEPISQDAVLRSYKHLMNKVHPDKGGNAHFASQLNIAKRVLLESLHEDSRH